jgi:peptide-methionine (S)-S-oxide reductase
MWLFSRQKLQLPTPEEALPGRAQPIMRPGRHTVLGAALAPPYPEGSQVADFALGCFWGAERKFWQTPGVITTAVGYEGGFTPNPTYEEVCSGLTGHTEAVQVVYDPARTTYEEVCSGRTGHAEAVRVVFAPARVSYGDLLRVFWEAHDPSQGMRQGNDVGTQYRSVVFVNSEEQRRAAEASREEFQRALTAAGYGPITTEIVDAGDFYFAEDYHQQYLDKNPNGYCGLGGTGVACPVGVAHLTPQEKA